MPVDPPRRSPLDGEPPFLREATRPVAGPPPGMLLIERVEVLVDRWRIGIISFLVPAVIVLLAAFWVMARQEPPIEEATASAVQDPSAVGAVVEGVSGRPDQAPGGTSVRTSTTGSDEPVLPPGYRAGPAAVGGVSGLGGVGPRAEGGTDSDDGRTTGEGSAQDAPTSRDDGTQGDGAGAGTGPPAGTPTTEVVEAPTSEAPVAEPPPAAPANPPPPPPAAPPAATTTTAAATTVTEAPPPSLGLCVLTVQWRTTVRSEPSADAEDVGRAGGWHAAIGATGSGDSLWYEIALWRGSGWIPANRVRSAWGECG